MSTKRNIASSKNRTRQQLPFTDPLVDNYHIHTSPDRHDSKRKYAEYNQLRKELTESEPPNLSEVRQGLFEIYSLSNLYILDASSSTNFRRSTTMTTAMSKRIPSSNNLVIFLYFSNYFFVINR